MIERNSHSVLGMGLSCALAIFIACSAAAQPPRSDPPPAPRNIAPPAEAWLLTADAPHAALLRAWGVPLEVLREDLDVNVEWLDTWPNSVSTTAPTGHAGQAARLETRRVNAGTLVLRPSQLADRVAEDLLVSAFGPKSAAVAPPLRLAGGVPLLSAALPASTPSAKKPITYEVVHGSGAINFSGSPILGVHWLPDGEHYVVRKAGRTCKVHADSGRTTPMRESEPLMAALAMLPGIDNDTARRLAGGARFDASRTAALVEHGGDLYFVSLAHGTARRLTETPQKEELATFSPDGRRVAFVRDYDLYVVDVQSAGERRLTTGGSSVLRHGKADWVYYEELFNRDWQAYHWSPDSQRLAFLQFDDSTVTEFSIVNPLATRSDLERERYPKSGDPNPRVRLGVVDASSGDAQWFELAEYSTDSRLITLFGWLPDSRGLFAYVQDRAQTWLDLVVLEPGKPTRRLFRDQTPAWIENYTPPTFLADGSFLWLSDRTGWRHIYHYGPNGDLRRTITGGQWEVDQLKAVDEKDGFVYFTATRDSPVAKHLYRVRIDGSELLRLTPAEGNHLVVLNHDGSRFVDICSSHRQPAQVRLFTGDGTLLRVIDSNPVFALDEYVLAPVQMLQIRARDGYLIDGLLIKPPDFDPAQKYPVWFMTYGGPRMPSVADSWSGGRAQDQLLAHLGIVVFRCDPRSASGKGAHYAWTAYKQLGVQELQDIEDAIGWLTSHPWIDNSRIGMSGHSYGGYLTAYCLTHSKLFRAGIAGAPVTDWKNYDSIYTERYMLAPQDNPAGYQRSSVVAAAANLHGKLLLLHGAIDDNVHLQNTLQLAHALQNANRDFEMMIYPQARHGLFGPHYQKLMLDFIRRNLRVP